MTNSKKPLRETIFDIIVDDIINRRLNQGEKLFESDLTKRFKVSRTPVREALMQLEQEGFVTFIKNRGAFINKMPLHKIAEIYEILSLIEGHAVAHVIKLGVSAEDLEYLENLQRHVEERAEQWDTIGYLEFNADFHNYFMERYGNETMSKLAKDLHLKVYSMEREGRLEPEYIDGYLESHRQIITGIKTQDAALARTAMQDHLIQTGKAIFEKMQQLTGMER